MEGQNKWMKKYIPANTTQKEARVALLIPVKIDFKKKQTLRQHYLHRELYSVSCNDI